MGYQESGDKAPHRGESKDLAWTWYLSNVCIPFLLNLSALVSSLVWAITWCKAFAPLSGMNLLHSFPSLQCLTLCHRSLMASFRRPLLSYQPWSPVNLTRQPDTASSAQKQPALLTQTGYSALLTRTSGRSQFYRPPGINLPTLACYGKRTNLPIASTVYNRHDQPLPHSILCVISK